MHNSKLTFDKFSKLFMWLMLAVTIVGAALPLATTIVNADTIVESEKTDSSVTQSGNTTKANNEKSTNSNQTGSLESKTSDSKDTNQSNAPNTKVAKKLKDTLATVDSENVTLGTNKESLSEANKASNATGELKSDNVTIVVPKSEDEVKAALKESADKQAASMSDTDTFKFVTGSKDADDLGLDTLSVMAWSAQNLQDHQSKKDWADWVKDLQAAAGWSTWSKEQQNLFLSGNVPITSYYKTDKQFVSGRSSSNAFRLLVYIYSGAYTKYISLDERKVIYNAAGVAKFKDVKYLDLSDDIKAYDAAKVAQDKKDVSGVLTSLVKVQSLSDDLKSGFNSDLTKIKAEKKDDRSVIEKLFGSKADAAMNGWTSGNNWSLNGDGSFTFTGTSIGINTLNSAAGDGFVLAPNGKWYPSFCLAQNYDAGMSNVKMGTLFNGDWSLNNTSPNYITNLSPENQIKFSNMMYAALRSSGLSPILPGGTKDDARNLMDHINVISTALWVTNIATGVDGDPTTEGFWKQAGTGGNWFSQSYGTIKAEYDRLMAGATHANETKTLTLTKGKDDGGVDTGITWPTGVEGPITTSDNSYSVYNNGGKMFVKPLVPTGKTTTTVINVPGGSKQLTAGLMPFVYYDAGGRGQFRPSFVGFISASSPYSISLNIKVTGFVGVDFTKSIILNGKVISLDKAKSLGINITEAEYTLQNTNGENADLTGIVLRKGTQVGASNVIHPDSSGSIAFGNLAYGDYQLVETKAPYGTTKDDNVYKFGPTVNTSVTPNDSGEFVFSLIGENGSKDKVPTFGFDVTKEITLTDKTPKPGTAEIANHTQFTPGTSTSINANKVDLTKVKFALQYSDNLTVRTSNGGSRDVEKGDAVLATDDIMNIFLNDAKTGVNSDAKDALKFGTLSISSKKEIQFNPTKDGKLEIHHLVKYNVSSIQLKEIETAPHTTATDKLISISADSKSQSTVTDELGDFGKNSGKNGFQDDIDLTGINLKKVVNYGSSKFPTGDIGQTDRKSAQYGLFSNEGSDKDKAIKFGDYRIEKMTTSANTNISKSGEVTFTVGSDGMIANLDDVIYGSYYIMELKSGTGLHLDKTKYYFGENAEKLNTSKDINYQPTAGVKDLQSTKTYTVATSSDDMKLIGVEFEKRGLWNNVASPWGSSKYDSESNSTVTDFGKVNSTDFTNKSKIAGSADLGASRRSTAVYKLVYDADTTDGKIKRGQQVGVTDDVVKHLKVLNGSQLDKSLTVGKITADGSKYVYFTLSGDATDANYARLKLSGLAYQSYALQEVISPSGMQIDKNVYHFGTNVTDPKSGYVGNDSSNNLSVAETQTPDAISKQDTSKDYKFDLTFDKSAFGSTDNVLTFGFNAVKLAEQNDATQLSVGENGAKLTLSPVGGNTDNVSVGNGSKDEYSIGKDALVVMPDKSKVRTYGQDISTTSRAVTLANGSKQNGNFEFRTIPSGGYILHSSMAKDGLLEIEDLLVTYGRSADGNGYTFQIGKIDHSTDGGKDVYAIKGNPLFTYDSEASGGSVTGIPSQSFWNSNSGVDLTSTTNNVINNEVFIDLASQNFSVIDKPTDTNEPNESVKIFTQAFNKDVLLKGIDAADNQEITDRIFIALTPINAWTKGDKLTVTSQIMDKLTNLAVGSTTVSNVIFDPSKTALDPNSGKKLPYVDVKVNVDARNMGGKDLVMFEDVVNTSSKKDTVNHPKAETDINNINQTVKVNPVPSIDIEKANGGIPDAGKGNDKDADNNAGPNDHDTEATAFAITTGTSTDIFFKFTNNGKEPLTTLKAVDKTVKGDKSVANIVWEYNGNVLSVNSDGMFVTDDSKLLVLPVGEFVIGKGTLPVIPAGELHGDTVDINGVGEISGKPVHDHDSWYGKGSASPEISTQAMIDGKASNTFTRGEKTNVGDIVHITGLSEGVTGKNNIKLWLVPNGDTTKATVVFEDSHDIVAKGDSYEDLVNTVYDTSNIKGDDYLVWTEVFEGKDLNGNAVIAKHEDLTNKHQTLKPVETPETSPHFGETGFKSMIGLTVVGVIGLVALAVVIIRKRKML